MEDVTIEPVLIHLIPIPGMLAARAQDDRGLPIPGVVSTAECDPTVVASLPMSAVCYDHIDWNAWASCAANNLCSYCRHPNDYYVYFVGHHSEIYVKTFVNPPMHDECAHYFFQVYPSVFMPRMRSGPIDAGGELPTRLGVYKTRDFKAVKPPYKTDKLNYMIRAGTQVGQTMWVDYPRDLMVEYNQRELAVRSYLLNHVNDDKLNYVEICSVYLSGQSSSPS